MKGFRLGRAGWTLSATLLAAAAATPALAQGCAASLQVEGAPMLTPMVYRVSGVAPGVAPAAALDQVARAAAGDFDNIRIDRRAGVVNGVQETSGSGRPQFVRFVVRKQGGGVRVDATFRVQAGQIAPEGAVRDTLCKIIAAAR